MTFPSLEYQRLWTLGDGTLCLLVERDDAPRFEICVVRGEDVIRQNRLYARGSAQMLAETWRATLEPPRVQQQSPSEHAEATAFEQQPPASPLLRHQPPATHD